MIPSIYIVVVAVMRKVLQKGVDESSSADRGR